MYENFFYLLRTATYRKIIRRNNIGQNKHLNPAGIPLRHNHQ